MTINVTERDFELLSRYVDRELPANERRQLDRRLATEASLAAALAGLQALQNQLQEAYNGLEKEPVPARTVALLQPRSSANVVQMPRRRAMGWRFALAASLVVAASATLLTRWDQHPTGPASGVDAMLAHALENVPSGGTGWETLADGREVRLVLSFRSQAGNWCREYLAAGAEGNFHAVACRGDNGWTTAVLSVTELPGSGEEYRPAGALDDQAVVDFVELNAAGIPLDARQEADLLARKWQ